METVPNRRLTRQRRVLLEELRKLRTHPSADELYMLVRQRLPRISLATVYRNLELLASDGAIRRIDQTSGPRRYDGNIAPHLHVQCTECGRVEDVPDVGLPEPAEQIRIPGWEITGRELTIQGVCGPCREDS